MFGLSVLKLWGILSQKYQDLLSPFGQDDLTIEEAFGQRTRDEHGQNDILIMTVIITQNKSLMGWDNPKGKKLYLKYKEELFRPSEDIFDEEVYSKHWLYICSLENKSSSKKHSSILRPIFGWGMVD